MNFQAAPSLSDLQTLPLRTLPLSVSSAELRSLPAEEAFRKPLLHAAENLSRHARRISSGRSEFEAGLDDPWFRLADFLDEIADDLRDRKPMGERAVEWATLLTMVSDHLDLELLDEDLHALVSVFVEACLLVQLERERVQAARATTSGIGERIRSRLDFVNEQLGDRVLCHAVAGTAA